ncbi:unnamed protein product [Polarella glacialis]|uniref:DEAD-box RNA helicase Q domain-containing protein n=1 Tax=Polarella glacialis TaxID=89957 RepID=A0A813J7W1_POLGL|nr:unnamed protein product [Polarella glacialis]
MPHPTASSLGSSAHQVSFPLSSSCRAHSSSASSNRGTSTASPPQSSPGGEMGDVGFSDLGLSGNTLRAIQEVVGFNELTKVQAQVLPALLGSGQRQSDFMVHARVCRLPEHGIFRAIRSFCWCVFECQCTLESGDLD